MPLYLKLKFCCTFSYPGDILITILKCKIIFSQNNNVAIINTLLYIRRYKIREASFKIWLCNGCTLVLCTIPGQLALSWRVLLCCCHKRNSLFLMSYMPQLLTYMTGYCTRMQQLCLVLLPCQVQVLWYSSFLCRSSQLGPSH